MLLPISAIGQPGSMPMCPRRHSLLQGGKTPGIVFSGPGDEQQLLAFDSTSLSKLVTKLGRTAWACTIFNLQVQREDGSSATLRALVRGASCLPLAPGAACCGLAWSALASQVHALAPFICCLQGRQVHMTADTDAVENVTFIYCPPERQVRVEVPLKVRCCSCAVDSWLFAELE